MDWEENLGARPAVFMKTGFESEGAQFSRAQKPSFELWYNYSIFLRLLHVSASLEQKEDKRHLILSRDKWFKVDKDRDAVMKTPTTDRLQRDKKTFKQKLVVTSKG